MRVGKKDKKKIEPEIWSINIFRLSLDILIMHNENWQLGEMIIPGISILDKG